MLNIKFGASLLNKLCTGESAANILAYIQFYSIMIIGYMQHKKHEVWNQPDCREDVIEACQDAVYKYLFC